MRLLPFITFAFLFSCSSESDKKEQITQTGVFEKAFIDQSVNAFLLDSIIYSGGNKTFQLNGGLFINSKRELFSIVLNENPLKSNECKTVASNFAFLNENELFDCSVNLRDDSLIICWENKTGCLRVTNPLDSIL